MKIAILENDINVFEKVKQNTKNGFEFLFYNSQDKLQNDYEQIEILLIGKTFVNKDLLDKISIYNLEIGLLNKGSIEFDDERISIIINHDELSQLTEKLKYLEAKIRIKRLLDAEQQNMNIIQNIKKQEKTNKHFDLNREDDFTIIEIKEPLEEYEKKEIIKTIKQTNYQIIVSFLMSYITSTQLSFLSVLWKEINDHNGKLFYWDKTKNSSIINIIKTCQLDRIIEIVDDVQKIKGD